MREDILLRFEGRLLPIDATVADVCGTVLARSAAAGRRIGVMDALIAATTEVHALTLVTRNIADFESTIDSGMVNPWMAE